MTNLGHMPEPTEQERAARAARIAQMEKQTVTIAQCASLLRTYIDQMPSGAYHVRDDMPLTLFRGGHEVLSLGCCLNMFDRHDPKPAEGLIQALVCLLNARDGTARFDHA
jgi:hypothetical protein